MNAAGFLETFGEWAWARHHNLLSWYVRPLFLLPLAWFACRRSGWGIVATLVALASSTFWFPAPSVPDPRAEEFLAFERDWLTGDWTAGKIGLTLLVPASLTAFCLAFWRRSLTWGLVLLNAMAVGKLAWGVVFGAGTGWAMTVPALVGLAACDLVVLLAARRLQHRDRPRPDRATAPASEGERSGALGPVGQGHP